MFTDEKHRPAQNNGSTELAKWQPAAGVWQPVLPAGSRHWDQCPPQTLERICSSSQSLHGFTCNNADAQPRRAAQHRNCSTLPSRRAVAAPGPDPSWLKLKQRLSYATPIH